MVVSVLSNVLYKPTFKVANRGYSIAVTDNVATDTSTQEAVEAKVDIPALMKTANAEAGKAVIKKCLTCHTFEKGGPNRVGPNLWNVAGDNKANVPGYTFSAAMTAAGGKWDDESLYHFINKPSKFIPGTKMSFIGLNKPQEIVDVIMYLKTVAHD
jgi:cytochrome c